MGSPLRHRFEQIANELRIRVKRGDWAPGSLLPSERQLQEEYQVSRTTVRRSLASLIDSGWAESVPNRGVCSKLGRPNPASLKVAFIDHRDHVHRSLFFKIHTRLANNRFEMVHIDSQEVGTMGALARAANEGYAAAIVWPKLSWVDQSEFLGIQAVLPVIAVDHSIAGEPSDLVMSDHMLGARQAVSHLIANNRKRIAVSGYFTNLEDAHLRFNGYLMALNENNISGEAHNFVFSSPQNHPYEDPRLLKYRLSEADRPDAVFVLHDMSVPPIVDAIMSAGLSMPQDVAVVGFGNDLPYNVDGVGLTTIGMNWDLVADAVVERISNRLERPNSPFRRVCVPTKLIVRGSCGASPETWNDDPYEVSSATVMSRMLPPKWTSRLSSSEYAMTGGESSISTSS